MTTSTPTGDTESITTDGATTPATDESGDETLISEWSELSTALQSGKMHNPTTDDILVIVDKTYNRVLTWRPGNRIVLVDIPKRHPGQSIPARCKWRFTESSDGFNGFCNLAECRYLGHNLWWEFMAQAFAQNGWEHFKLMNRGDGYTIQVPYWFSLRPLSARSDGTGIDIGRPNGTLWEFIRVSEY
jgi:hypothetical protein